MHDMLNGMCWNIVFAWFQPQFSASSIFDWFAKRVHEAHFCFELTARFQVKCS